MDPPPHSTPLYTPHASPLSHIQIHSLKLLPSTLSSSLVKVSDRSDSFLHQASYMVDIEAHLPTAFDPFAEAKESGAPGAKEYVHIRIQQRNGKKSLTTVQGLRKEYSYDKILKDLKKEFCCNGNVVQDKELGKVIQLQGDQRKNVSQFLVSAGLVKKDQIKIHGF
ncbi:PREDICTED: protein translation factor SUI1 homolog 2-like [Ipomoea nil]|uniref:protein translation factor SUI1 homolog 2-like n=1 Tax=Ipomoea nil TaxID=35883 RepID=UPI000901BACD|nr:PREDICTED: protein translation factor SUI1 homolog 2-like [Ipomoea nil]